MHSDFPPELISAVLEHLEKAFLLKCSLVCRTWLAAARNQLLDDYTLELDNSHTATFLRLLESPHSSLHHLRILGLRLSQKGIKDVREVITGRSVGGEWYKECSINDFLCWRTLDGKSIPAIFPTISSLSIEWLDLGSLSQPAIDSLRLDYTDITTLKLNNIRIPSFSRLQDLICTFPSLNTLHLMSHIHINPFEIPDDDQDRRESQNHCARPRSVHVVSSAPEVLNLLASLNTDGLTLLDITSSQHVVSESFVDACNNLLQATGSNLKRLGLQFSANGSPIPAQVDSKFNALIKFSNNPNLEHINIRFPSDSPTVPFVQNLDTDTTKLQSLDLSLLKSATMDQISQALDWESFDDVLSNSKRFPNLSRLGINLYGFQRMKELVWQLHDTTVRTRNAASTLDHSMRRVMDRMSKGEANNEDLLHQESLKSVERSLQERWEMFRDEAAQEREKLQEVIRDLLPRARGIVYATSTL
ncbi:hypothetical protein K435DRAFT_963039 [Dendrothele bispora CBS 962.96]|uniref:F-box domain-containing protein n=1 Tax=Dendrothele bispora (strain CBS 962.96) TaxID=1314807 RepID=A0A4S8MIH4_DENBC|nr:hypothetical protein K435DRAFT_963039 [Dendrothele bispora CBS 962.96]